MLRASVTTVESFRLCMQSDWYSLERFIEECQTRVVPNEAMQRGSAFHKILENPYDYILDEDPEIMRCDGWEFFADELWPLVPGPFAQKELRCSGIFSTAAGRILMSGRADVVEGTTIQDHKMTKSLGFEKYLPSLQWRLYLEMFGLDRFQYNVCTYRQERDSQIVKIKERETYAFYRYPKMRDDLVGWLELFITFVRDHGLERHFQPFKR